MDKNLMASELVKIAKEVSGQGGGDFLLSRWYQAFEENKENALRSLIISIENFQKAKDYLESMRGNLYEGEDEGADVQKMIKDLIHVRVQHDVSSIEQDLVKLSRAIQDI